MKNGGERERGFTLLEILVTLTIAVVVIMISAPKISALFPTPEEKVVSLFRLAIMRARWLAARDQIPVEIVLDSMGQAIQIREERQKGGNKVLLTRRLPRDVRMVGFWNAPAQKRKVIRFLPNGQGGGFGVFLERQGRRLTVVGYPYRPGVEVWRGWIEEPWYAG